MVILRTVETGPGALYLSFPPARQPVIATSRARIRRGPRVSAHHLFEGVERGADRRLDPLVTGELGLGLSRGPLVASTALQKLQNKPPRVWAVPRSGGLSRSPRAPLSEGKRAAEMDGPSAGCAAASTATGSTPSAVGPEIPGFQQHRLAARMTRRHQLHRREFGVPRTASPQPLPTTAARGPQAGCSVIRARARPLAQVAFTSGFRSATHADG
jgi:hypothetical protein